MILAPRAHSVRMVSSEGWPRQGAQNARVPIHPAAAAHSGFSVACTSNNPTRISAEPLRGRKRQWLGYCEQKPHWHCVIGSIIAIVPSKKVGSQPTRPTVILS